MRAIVQDEKMCEQAGLLGVDLQPAKYNFQNILLVKHIIGQPRPKGGWGIQVTSLWKEQHMHMGMGDIFGSLLRTRAITIS